MVATITHPSHAVCHGLRTVPLALLRSSSNSGRSCTKANTKNSQTPGTSCQSLEVSQQPHPPPPTGLQIICEMQKRTLAMSSFEIQTFSLTSSGGMPPFSDFLFYQSTSLPPLDTSPPRKSVVRVGWQMPNIFRCDCEPRLVNTFEL